MSNPARWLNVTPSELASCSLAEKLEYISTILIHECITYRSLLLHLFGSQDTKLRARAGNFLKYQSSATDLATRFPAAKLFELWWEGTPSCRPNLQDLVILPYAKKIALAESDRGISDPSLQVKLGKLTIEDIRQTLDPHRLIAKYRELFPFTTALFLTFTASPNRHRKRNLNGSVDSSQADPEEYEDDGVEANEVTDDGWTGKGDWRSDPQWEGFSRWPLLVRAARIYDSNLVLNELQGLLLCFSIMLFIRNRATNLLALLIGLFLKINGAGSRIISVFSKAGVSTSNSTLERVKIRLSDDAVQQAVAHIMSGRPYYIIFDNINLYLRKFEQRLSNRNSMIHATNAAIIPLKLKSDFEDLAAFLRLRGQRAKAVLADFIPSKEDDKQMMDRWTVLVTQMLVSYTPGSHQWPNYDKMRTRAIDLTPNIRRRPVAKTTPLPFGVFDVDEGSKKGLVQMLDALREKSTSTKDDTASKLRIFEGDWLTANNLRQAQKERFDDCNTYERMEYACAHSALWHFGLNATNMIVRAHMGHSIKDPASLLHHKNLLRRTWDINTPNYAAAKSLIRHSLIARILCFAM